MANQGGLKISPRRVLKYTTRGNILIQRRVAAKASLKIALKLKLPVVTLFQGIKQVRRRMRLAVIFNLFIAFVLHG